MIESPAAARRAPALIAAPNATLPSWLAGGLLVLTVGVTVVLLPATLWVYPDLLPFAVPLLLLAGALALWGAARLDQMRVVAKAKRLGDENAQLLQNLGWLSDTARELRESQRALDEALQRAEAASQAKSRLLATVSHEFRTPLNGILGLTGLLLETEQTADQRTYARAVYSSGEALLALVDDMLDFSKIEAGRLELPPPPTEPQALL